MKEELDSKNGAKQSDEKASDEKKIPIIQTLKPKKRYTKQEKEMIKAMQDVMDAIIRQQNAKV